MGSYVLIIFPLGGCARVVSDVLLSIRPNPLVISSRHGRQIRER